MKTHAEPTSPGEPAEKPNRLRIALLSAVFVALGAHTVLSEGAEHSQGSALAPARPTNAPEKESYQDASSLLEEIHAELGQTTCRFADKKSALARLKELPALIPSWQQTARVEPSELLRSLGRIAETMNCSVASGTPPPGAAEVAELRDSLNKKLEQDVRSLFARLRRAQREGDRESALRNVSELQELLQYHRGPLRQHLDRLARLYRGP